MSLLRKSGGERENIKGRVRVVPCARFAGRGSENTHRDGVAGPSLLTYRHRGAWRGDTRNW